MTLTDSSVRLQCMTPQLDCLCACDGGGASSDQQQRPPCTQWPAALLLFPFAAAACAAAKPACRATSCVGALMISCVCRMHSRPSSTACWARSSFLLSSPECLVCVHCHQDWPGNTIESPRNNATLRHCFKFDVTADSPPSQLRPPPRPRPSARQYPAATQPIPAPARQLLHSSSHSSRLSASPALPASSVPCRRPQRARRPPERPLGPLQRLGPAWQSAASRQ